jgi:hypothetical protein
MSILVQYRFIPTSDWASKSDIELPNPNWYHIIQRPMFIVNLKISVTRCDRGLVFKNVITCNSSYLFSQWAVEYLTRIVKIGLNWVNNLLTISNSNKQGAINIKKFRCCIRISFRLSNLSIMAQSLCIVGWKEEWQRERWRNWWKKGLAELRISTLSIVLNKGI